MKYHELKVEGRKNRKRVGRGISAGQGKTAGRGTKGQNSRSGGGVRPGFEGGQNPLAKRIPKKRGFKSLTPQKFQVVSIEKLNRFKAGETVGSEQLLAAGLIKKLNEPVKLLANGSLKIKLNLRVDAASRPAREAVLQAGGKLDLIEPKR